MKVESRNRIAKTGGTSCSDDLCAWASEQATLLRAGQLSKIDALRRLGRNPGLKARLDEVLDEACQNGRDRASSETDIDHFPPFSPYSWDAIMNRDFVLAPLGEDES